jgi:hypothetical protein
MPPGSGRTPPAGGPLLWPVAFPPPTSEPDRSTRTCEGDRDSTVMLESRHNLNTITASTGASGSSLMSGAYTPMPRSREVTPESYLLNCRN